MHPTYKKYLLIGIGAIFVVLIMTLWINVFAAIFGLIIYLGMMAHDEKQTYEMIDEFNYIAIASNKSKAEIAKMTGFSESKVEALLHTTLHPITKAEIKQALKVLQQ